jgi:YfiH family protein
MHASSLSDALIVPDWPAPAGVRAVVTTRRLPGNSRPPYDACNLGLRSGEDEATVRANRALLRRSLGLPSEPRWLRQVHGRAVVAFDTADVSPETIEPEADAAVTGDAGVVLGILTADCMPVLFCADDGSALGAAHAGWRGLAGGVLEACVARLGTSPERLLAWLGPAIGQVSFEVGGEVRAAFVDHDPAAAQAFVPGRAGRWQCDLYALARRRLAALGVSRVSGGGFDTMGDASFYSYRRDGAHSGRFATLIWRDA